MMRLAPRSVARPVVPPRSSRKKNDDRHVRNEIEDVNRSRGEAAETKHHPFVGREKGYITTAIYEILRTRYKECLRTLNGLERTLERKLPESERRWVVSERLETYDDKTSEPAGSG